VIDRAPFAAARFRERWRPRRFDPVAAAVRRSEYGRAEVSGLRGGEERLPIARIEHQMIDDVAVKVRSVHPPCPPRPVAVE
jgi:hypothetical protein